MTHLPRICVVIPVDNHALTLPQVIRGARCFRPVLVVDDGSTDATAEILRREEDIVVVRLAQNQGKAAALQAGFARAWEGGFTHAITLDADGQHPTEAVPAFIEACERQPEALIIGVRDLRKEGAPRARRWSNGLSTFWFRRLGRACRWSRSRWRAITGRPHRGCRIFIPGATCCRSPGSIRG